MVLFQLIKCQIIRVELPFSMPDRQFHIYDALYEDTRRIRVYFQVDPLVPEVTAVVERQSH